MVEGNGAPSQGFLAPLLATEGRSNMLSPAAIPRSSTPGSAAAQTLNSIMHQSSEGVDNWLLHEISSFNVPVKRRCFPKEATRDLREALNETL